MSETNTVSPLREPMIETWPRASSTRTPSAATFPVASGSAWLNRSPDTATPEEVRRFQLYLVEGGTSICNRNRIMTGVRFLFRVTLRRRDLAAEVWHIKEPQKLPPVCRCPPVARSCRTGTSTLRSLSGADRRWQGELNSAENDPQQKSHGRVVDLSPD
jgi:hypothetical protein